MLGALRFEELRSLSLSVSPCLPEKLRRDAGHLSPRLNDLP